MTHSILGNDHGAPHKASHIGEGRTNMLLLDSRLPLSQLWQHEQTKFATQKSSIMFTYQVCKANRQKTIDYCHLCLLHGPKKSHSGRITGKTKRNRKQIKKLFMSTRSQLTPSNNQKTQFSRNTSRQLPWDCASNHFSKRSLQAIWYLFPRYPLDDKMIYFDWNPTGFANFLCGSIREVARCTNSCKQST